MPEPRPLQQTRLASEQRSAGPESRLSTGSGICQEKAGVTGDLNSPGSEDNGSGGQAAPWFSPTSGPTAGCLRTGCRREAPDFVSKTETHTIVSKDSRRGNETAPSRLNYALALHRQAPWAPQGLSPASTCPGNLLLG